MSDDEQEVQAGPVVKVARDLTEIIKLCDQLEDQARELARARIDGTSLPGGRAMVAKTPVGSPEEWAEQIAYEELWHFATCQRPHHRECRYAEHVADGEDDVAPLQTMLFWSEQWREIHGQPLEGRRPTLSTEANLIRWALDWAWDNELHWDDFAQDINRVRVRLEDVLYAGKRVERSRVPCDRCAQAPMLILLRGDVDTHKCPACKHKFDLNEYGNALKHQLRSEGAAKYVPKPDAVATLRDQGRSPETIKKWFGSPVRSAKRKGQWVEEVDGEAVLESYCELGTRRVLVWWPDLWRLHLSTQKRNRAS